MCEFIIHVPIYVKLCGTNLQDSLPGAILSSSLIKREWMIESKYL